MDTTASTRIFVFFIIAGVLCPGCIILSWLIIYSLFIVDKNGGYPLVMFLIVTVRSIDTGPWPGVTGDWSFGAQCAPYGILFLCLVILNLVQNLCFDCYSPLHGYRVVARYDG